MTPNSQRQPHADETVDLAAASWLVRRDRGLTPEEQDEFLQWLAADARHADWFARHDRTWKDLNGLAQWRPEHSTEPNPDLLARPRPRFRLLRLMPLAAAAVAALMFYFWKPWTPHDSAIASADIGYQSRVLDDGSVVELNRGASVTVQFTAAERHVRLVKGEASFKVAKNPNRPFIVHAGSVNVRAVGTAFDVRLGAASVEVLVTEGRVQVRPPAPSSTGSQASLPDLVAGQRAVLSLTSEKAPQVNSISEAEIAQLLQWQPKLLDFSSAPLAEVVAEFNHRNHVQLVIAEPALASVPIVASFRSDNVDGFVRLLELTMGVKAERQGDTITLTRAR